MNFKNSNMTCIDERLLQQYIDEECTEKKKGEVENHLKTCGTCKKKHAEMEKLSGEVKRSINSLTPLYFGIPEFRKPNVRRLSRKRNLYIYSLSAACILLFILLIHKKKEIPQNKITFVQCVPAEVDANRPASDQDFVIEVYDSNSQEINIK